jgi:ABC-type dipeptide/oligopeptide/nickel transport system permease component
VFVFTLLEFTPGDPAKIILGQTANEEALAAIRVQFHLNDPYIVRLGRYFAQLLHGDLGTSYITRQPIAGAIAARLPLTLRIAFFGILVGACIGILAGTVSAVKQFSIADRVLTFISLFGNSAPSFWTAMLFVLIFAVKLQILPATGSYGFKYWILPVATIGLQCSSGVTRMTRSSVLEVIRQDYIRTAKAKGVPYLKIIFGHALKNSLLPVITYFGPMLAYIVTGSLVVEQIFAVPGIGRAFISSITGRDYPMIMGTTIILATLIVIMNLVSDIMYKIVDPRITLE